MMMINTVFPLFNGINNIDFSISYPGHLENTPIVSLPLCLEPILAQNHSTHVKHRMIISEIKLIFTIIWCF